MATSFQGWGSSWGDSWGSGTVDPNAMQGSASFSFNATLSVTTQGNLKYWTGSAWVTGVLKRYIGSSWETRTIQTWNGSAWI